MAQSFITQQGPGPLNATNIKDRAQNESNIRLPPAPDALWREVGDVSEGSLFIEELQHVPDAPPCGAKSQAMPQEASHGHDLRTKAGYIWSDLFCH